MRTILVEILKLIQKLMVTDHENVKHSTNGLTSIITRHHATKLPKNDSNGKLVAGEHLENGSVVHNSIDNESEAAKLLSLEDGSLFQVLVFCINVAVYMFVFEKIAFSSNESLYVPFGREAKMVLFSVREGK